MLAQVNNLSHISDCVEMIQMYLPFTNKIIQKTNGNLQVSFNYLFNFTVIKYLICKYKNHKLL